MHLPEQVRLASADEAIPLTERAILTQDDIPEDGKMQGRNRLEIISPSAARTLAAVSDFGLNDPLPPAPADVIPPSDETAILWFEVAKPLMSTSAHCGGAHLAAFITFVNHAQSLALYRAHTATDPATQRQAIADWVYWQHLAVLIGDAVTTDASV